ncbi:MAG: alpha/beta hydrolase [Planctomycetota bacterium]
MRIVLMPGLGADSGLFDPQREELGDRLSVVVPEAADATGSFSDAADRIATKIDAAGLTAEPYALGGMSFGGSLALEVSRRVARPPERLVLIASNRTSDTIPRRFGLARSLGRLAPRSVAPAVLARLADVFAWREGLEAHDRVWLRGIARRTDVPLLLWGARAIAGWRFTDGDAAALPAPIHQIHGERDWVLPMAERHATVRLPGARHLINRTHAAVVNRWLIDPDDAAR